MRLLTDMFPREFPVTRPAVARAPLRERLRFRTVSPSETSEVPVVENPMVPAVEGECRRRVSGGVDGVAA